MDAVQQGLTAQMAFRQLNLGGAGFQQPKAQTPRQAGPDSASSLHAAAAQLNAAHLEPEAIALLAEKGSQTTRETRSPWTPAPTTSRTAPHNLMDSIWSVDHPSDQSSSALPDTKVTPRPSLLLCNTGLWGHHKEDRVTKVWLLHMLFNEFDIWHWQQAKTHSLNKS